MIKIDNLSFSFENKKIFENCNICIPDKKLSVLMGANGTGKTSLFKIITGQISVNSSEIYNDFKKIFFLPQKIKYPENLTLFEYVTSFFFANSLKWFLSQEEVKKTEEVLELLNLTDRRDILIENLSSGELQKANIATALLSDADCLLLDEPTSNMDLINQINVLEILKKISNHNVTCVIIMHDINAAAKYGDFFVAINKNQQFVSGDKESFFTEENLSNIFGIDFDIVRNKNNERIILPNPQGKIKT